MVHSLKADSDEEQGDSDSDFGFGTCAIAEAGNATAATHAGSHAVNPSHTENPMMTGVDCPSVEKSNIPRK